LSLLSFLAQAAAPATTAPIAPPWVQFLNSGIMPIILVLIVFMLFTSGGKRKTERERKALLDNLKKGDHVKLIGGEYGTVVDVRGTKVLVKVDESSNTKILYAREAIVAVEKETAAAKEDTK
jgi:preprotein translocase subunit YajC